MAFSKFLLVLLVGCRIGTDAFHIPIRNHPTRTLGLTSNRKQNSCILCGTMHMMKTLNEPQSRIPTSSKQSQGPSRRDFLSYFSAIPAIIFAGSASAQQTSVKREEGLCSEAIRFPTESCASQPLSKAEESRGSHLINEKTGQQIYLIGTAHISEASANQVEFTAREPASGSEATAAGARYHPHCPSRRHHGRAGRVARFPQRCAGRRVARAHVHLGDHPAGGVPSGRQHPRPHPQRRGPSPSHPILNPGSVDARVLAPLGYPATMTRARAPIPTGRAPRAPARGLARRTRAPQSLPNGGGV